MDSYLILIIIIFVLSVIQSFFGVGLLVFGTPLLLILGYSFEESLTFLLPSSIIISLIQTLAYDERLTSSDLHKKISLFSVPGIIIGLLFVLSDVNTFNIGLVVGLILLTTVFFRNIKYLFLILKKIFNSNLNIYLFLMGIIHGVSNMGGGFLTILVTSIFDNKNTQRRNIAFGYLIFGVTQIIILLILNFHIFTFWSLIFPILSLVVYYSVGNLIFKKISENSYNYLMSILIFLYGIVLIIINI